MAHDETLRKELMAMLRGGHAHATFDRAVEGMPLDRIGVRPAGIPHSAWELLEHLRISQYDILRFSQTAEYYSPKWPDGYWPNAERPEHASQWENSVQLFKKDLAAFEAMLEDHVADLNRPFPWGEGQTLLREALLLLDHNSYHIGELVLVRRALGVWHS